MKALVHYAVVCTLAAAGVALASTPSHAESESRRPSHPAFLAECGSCHVPYPARLLSAASWRTVMNNLDRHFGTDASLDAATTAAIRGYLEAGAGAGRKVSADP
ncbi:MAG TPA: cytochrome C, partial [Casimicrobiaceae bacterium]|nr:cytochrome C [Casimicrobiaceae bacterium]